MLETLFVGIDVSKDTNYVYALNFNRDNLYKKNIPNTKDGANTIVSSLIETLNKNNLSKIIFILESTGVYSSHIALFNYINLYNYIQPLRSGCV